MSKKPHHLVKTLRDLAKEQSALLADLMTHSAAEIERLEKELSDVRRMLTNERETVRRYEEQWIDEHV